MSSYLMCIQPHQVKIWEVTPLVGGMKLKQFMQKYYPGVSKIACSRQRDMEIPNVTLDEFCMFSLNCIFIGYPPVPQRAAYVYLPNDKGFLIHEECDVIEKFLQRGFLVWVEDETTFYISKKFAFAQD